MAVGLAAKSAFTFAKSPWGGRILAAGAGTLGGIAGMLALGGSKKAGGSAEATAGAVSDITTTTKYDQRMWDYSVSTVTVADSPGASVDFKKDMSQTPSTSVTPSVSQSPSAAAEGGASGTDLTTLALIGGAAVLGHAIITKK